MSTDKREAILVRLLEIYDGLAEDCAFRNRTNIPESKLPAIVLLDADENADDSAYGRGRPAKGPVQMEMRPETYVLLAADAKDVGTELSEWRAEIIKAVLTDETLVALTHGGDIRYDGFETGLAAGRSMQGEARISFTFRYVLQPTRL